MLDGHLGLGICILPVIGVAGVIGVGMAIPDKPIYPVLVVDDDANHAEACVEFLTELGWEASMVGSGHEALGWLQEKGHSVVLCDYNMPGMTGLDVLANIDPARTGFVMLTGIHDDAVVAEALRRKADDFTFKPVTDWDDLSAKLQRVAKNIRSREDARREAAKMAQMADWQAWKAGFLKQDQEKDMQELLRMLHVQFNQDANYSQLLDLIEEVGRGEVSRTMRVKVPVDVLTLVANALRPIARFSDGISIAAKLLGDLPKLRGVKLSDVLHTIQHEYHTRWKELAALRQHEFELWVSDDLKRMSDRFLLIDREPTFKALNELVVNAFKHSDPGSSVKFSLAGDRANLTLAMSNMPSEKRSHIGGTEIYGLPREFEAQAFRLFFRLREDAQLTIYEEDWPMGLGLPLVRSVFMGAGGDITVRNEMWHLSGSREPRLLVTARGSLPLKEASDLPPEPEDDSADDGDSIELF